MLKTLFLLFIIVPLLELYVLITVGSGIGGITTIILCLITAGVGAFLVRYQGVQTLLDAQKALLKGEAPGKHVLHGVILALTGILLLTPGFITDVVGFILLLPIVRNMIIARILKNTQSTQTSNIIDVEIIDQDGQHLR